MEIDFEVVSVLRPVRVRVRSAEGTEAAQEYQVRPADGAATLPDGNWPWPGADPHSDVILWAYYEACRSGAAYGGWELPWERPHRRRAWRAFRDTMLADPDLHRWWNDPREILDRAQRAYRDHHHGFGA